MPRARAQARARVGTRGLDGLQTDGQLLVGRDNLYPRTS